MTILKAKRADWKAKDMPEKHTSLSVNMSFTPKQFEKISLGVIPRGMEDKWFIYYLNNCLHLHRSWTGDCIYQVKFQQKENNVVVAEVVVNRDASQYSETDDNSDIEYLEMMLKSLSSV